MSDLSRTQWKTVAEDLIRDIDAGFPLDHSEVTNLVDIITDLKGYYKDLDREYIKRAKQIGEHLDGDDVFGEDWPHFAPEIAAGTYPLEKLPEHIRDLAQELYYKEKASVAAKT